MALPLILETTKSGVEICSGRPKTIIVGNWYETDEDTGFVSQKAIESIIKIIARKLIDMKFTNAKQSEQNVMINGDTIMIFQSARSSGKFLNESQATGASRSIMEQFFKHATATGYFDEVDPEKLKASLDMDEEQLEKENSEGGEDGVVKH